MSTRPVKKPPAKRNIRPEDAKSARQTYSCAECKRLKLKCSRVFPCTMCEKRGCAQICPQGEMRSGKGKRLILANTEQLHERIERLELALSQAHAKMSSTPHPLLQENYDFKIEADGGEADDTPTAAFGTLTIRNEGESHFVGSFAGSEYLRGEEDTPSGASTPYEQDHSGSVPPAAAPPRAAYSEGAVKLQDAFIAGGGAAFHDIEALRHELPDWNEEGRGLVDSYYENVDWMYPVLSRAMFERDHLAAAYDPSSKLHAHKLACVFLVMAVGVMFDLNRQPWDSRGERLFLLGRACMGLIGLENASPATVQAFHVMGTYILNDRSGNGADVFWPILGSAVKVAQSIGLHRDGTSFGLSPFEVEERRQVHWEILTYDRLQAMCFGRPSACNNRSIDAKFPEDQSILPDPDGFHRSKYRLMFMMESVIDIQTQTTPVSYSNVCKLDAELVEFRESLPETLLPKEDIQKLPLDRLIPAHVVIHRLGIRLLVAQTRLLLNRPYLVRALKDNPDDPAESKYREGFLATYTSAQEIVQVVKRLVIYHPSLIARWWFFWFHAFTASMCLGAISIFTPSCAFATPAFNGLSIVCDIAQASRDGCRAKTGLPQMMRLRQRAQEVLTEAAARARTRGSTDAATAIDLSHLNSAPKLIRRLGTASSSPSVSPQVKDEPPFLAAAYHPGAQSSPGFSEQHHPNGAQYVEHLVPMDPHNFPNVHHLPQAAADYGANWFNALWQSGGGGAHGNMENPPDLSMAFNLAAGPGGNPDMLNGFDFDAMVTPQGQVDRGGYGPGMQQ